MCEEGGRERERRDGIALRFPIGPPSARRASTRATTRPHAARSMRHTPGRRTLLASARAEKGGQRAGWQPSDGGEAQFGARPAPARFDASQPLPLFLTHSAPVVAMVWEGKNVVATGRKIIGATNPLASEPGTIR